MHTQTSTLYCTMSYKNTTPDVCENRAQIAMNPPPPYREPLIIYKLNTYDIFIYIFRTRFVIHMHSP